MTMTLYEMLLDEYENEVDVFEVPMINKGLYADNIIWIKKDQTTSEKLGVLAEELGHHYTSEGDILDQSTAANRKQERQARAWGYSLLVPLDRLVKNYFKSTTFEELAESLDVTPEYLNDVISYYNEHFGCSAVVDGFVIEFSPFRIRPKVLR